MTTQHDLERLQHATVYAQGDRVGDVDQVYLDDDTDTPKWVTVSTGLFGSQTSFVPIDDAALDGDRLEVTVSKAEIKDAPRLDGDTHLSREEERELYRYYGRPDPSARPAHDQAGHTGVEDGERRGADLDGRDGRHDEVRDTSGHRGFSHDGHGGHGHDVGVPAGVAAAGAAAAGRRDDRDVTAQTPQPGTQATQQQTAGQAPLSGHATGQQMAAAQAPRGEGRVLRRYLVEERIIELDGNTTPGGVGDRH